MDTANYLFIHRNSIKYRLERIRDIADFDLNDPREQFIMPYMSDSLLFAGT